MQKQNYSILASCHCLLMAHSPRSTFSLLTRYITNGYRILRSGRNQRTKRVKMEVFFLQQSLVTQSGVISHPCIMYHVKLSHCFPNFGNFDQMSCRKISRRKVCSRIYLHGVQFCKDMLSPKELSL